MPSFFKLRHYDVSDRIEFCVDCGESFVFHLCNRWLHLLCSVRILFRMVHMALVQSKSPGDSLIKINLINIHIGFTSIDFDFGRLFLKSIRKYLTRVSNASCHFICYYIGVDNANIKYPANRYLKTWTR